MSRFTWNAINAAKDETINRDTPKLKVDRRSSRSTPTTPLDERDTLKSSATTKGMTRKGPSKPYHQYTATSSDTDIFRGDPDYIDRDNLFRLNKDYPIGELVQNVLKFHPNSGTNSMMLSNRLSRSVTRIAIREGRDRADVMQELRNAQWANGILANGRRVEAPEAPSREVVAEKPSAIRNAEDAIVKTPRKALVKRKDITSVAKPTRGSSNNDAKQEPINGPMGRPAREDSEIPSKFVSALTEQSMKGWEEVKRRQSGKTEKQPGAAKPFDSSLVQQERFRTF